MIKITKPEQEKVQNNRCPLHLQTLKHQTDENRNMSLWKRPHLLASADALHMPQQRQKKNRRGVTVPTINLNTQMSVLNG